MPDTALLRQRQRSPRRIFDCAANSAKGTIVYYSRMSGISQNSDRHSTHFALPEVRSWAEKVATRLWMLQTSFADDPAPARHDYLVEEIERSLKDVSASRRSEYLAALM